MRGMSKISPAIPKKTVGVVLDADVAEAIEAYSVHIRERRNGMIQRVMIETMAKAGFWPPKPKSKKKSGA